MRWIITYREMTSIVLTSSVKLPDKPIGIAGINPTGKIVVCYESGQMQAIADSRGDLETFNTVKCSASKVATTITISQTGLILIVTFSDGMIRCYETARPSRIVWCRKTHRDRVLGVAFAIHDTKFVTCSLDLTVRVWDALLGNNQMAMRFSKPIRAIAMTAYDKELILAGGDESYFGIWTITGILKAKIACDANIKACCCHQTRNLFAFVTAQNVASIYSYKWSESKVDTTLQAVLPYQDIHDITFARYDDLLLSLSNDGDRGTIIRIWRTGKMQHLQACWTNQKHITHAVFISGHTVVTNNSDRTLSFWHIDYPAYQQWLSLIQQSKWQELSLVLTAWIKSNSHIRHLDVLQGLIQHHMLKPSQYILVLQILCQMELTPTLNMPNAYHLFQNFYPMIRHMIDIYAMIATSPFIALSCEVLQYIFLEMQILNLKQNIVTNQINGLTLMTYLDQYLSQATLADRCQIYATVARVHKFQRLGFVDAVFIDAWSCETLYAVLKIRFANIRNPLPDQLLQHKIDGLRMMGLKRDAHIFGIDYNQVAMVVQEIYTYRHQILQPYRQHGAIAATSVPKIAICPLSLTIMTDPVLAADGYHYERQYIEQWMQCYQTSPMTHVILAHNRLVANPYLQDVILCIQAMMAE